MSDKKEELHQEEICEDEILSSQVPDTEPQSSCETFMSQQSENEELSEEPEDKNVEVSGAKSTDTSALSSSLEANTSGENIGSSHTGITPASTSLENPVQEEVPTITEKGDEFDGDLFEDEGDQDKALPKQQTKKRKGRSNESTPSPKRTRIDTRAEVAPDENHSVEFIENSQKPDVSVLEISSTPEKTITIDDSQEFSLRIEEGSPTGTQCSGEKSDNSRKEVEVKRSSELHKETTTSPTAGSTSASYATASQSQKSTQSWSSHTNTQNLSWNSHKYMDDHKTLKEANGDPDMEHCESQNSSSESCIGKPVDSTIANTCLMEAELGPVFVHGSWVVDSKNKVPSFKIKGFSFAEEHPVDKPGRMSMVSTTSAKSSSSTGSVGLPGPFPLPGRTIRSRLSTVSSASSASSNQAWDGPFLKPQVPGSKLYQNVVFTCGKCEHSYPVDSNHSSPVINGSPPVIEEVVPEAKSLTPKRGRRIQLQGSQAGSSVSSGPLEEESSSSSSQPPPQASSTPAKQPRSRVRNVKKQNGTVQERKSTKKEVQPSMPARTPRTVGRGSRNGTSNSKKLEVEKGEGQPVLARWGGDGRYYPGWVGEPLASTQVLVRFCDGQRKSTSLTKVVKADVITPGTLVLAATRSGEYEEALVVRVDTSGAEPVYMVERDKTQREVQFASIALLESVVTELTVSEAQKVAAPTNFNDLSLENIIVHPRKRSARTPVHGSSGRRKKRQTTPQPCTSHGQTYNGPEETYGDTDSSTHSSCSLDLRGKEIKPLDVECFPPETTKTKLAYNRGNMAFKKKGGSAEEVVAKELGPIPELGSNLFTDCVFLITYTDTVKLHRDGVIKYSSTDDTNGISLNLKLWRDRLRLQIRNGGGKVYNSFNEVTKEDLPNTYLITDKQCNTPLYLQCLVNGVPIYSHTIVISCCVQNRPWKEVIASRGVKRMLAGYSLSRKCLVNPRSLTPLHNRSLLLALSDDSSLSAFWQSLITKAGGSVDLHPHGSLDDTKYDVVVTDADCDRELVAEACSAKVPLVSMTWLQQVIISGEWRPTTEHPLYKYNSYGDGDDSPEY